MNEAARALRALGLELQDCSPVQCHVLRALTKIEAEDAELSAQANTPEAYDAKERWVQTICDKRIAEAFREVGADHTIAATACLIRADLMAVIDKLDPPKPQMIADRPEDVAPPKEAIDPLNALGIEVRGLKETCTVCGQDKHFSEPCPCEEWPLGPGDKMSYTGSGVVTVAYIVNPHEFIDTRGESQDTDMWHRVELAPVAVGNTVVLHTPELEGVAGIVNEAIGDTIEVHHGHGPTISLKWFKRAKLTLTHWPQGGKT